MAAGLALGGSPLDRADLTGDALHHRREAARVVEPMLKKMLMPVNGMSSAVGMVCVLLMLALAAAGARQQHRASEYGISYHAGALSSRSESFNETMVELNSVLTEAYNAQRAIIVPGSEVFALESAARQVGHQGQVMILQSGAPAHTWGQIFGHSQIAYDVFRVKPEWTTRDGFRIFQPLAPQKVVAQIQERRPDVVFASHVDASTGLILPDAYIAEIGEATRAVNGLFVLEGIHAGQHWIDMEESMVDLYIAAPQKGLNGRVRNSSYFLVPGIGPRVHSPPSLADFLTAIISPYPATH